MKTLCVSAICVVFAGCIGSTGPDSVAQIVVSTSSDLSTGLFLGDQVQWTAQSYNAGGNAVNATVMWSSAQPNIVTITNSGLMNVVGVGTAFFTASSGASSTIIRILVDGNVTGDVTVLPATATVKVGTPVQFGATLKTTQTNPSRGRTPLWSTSNSSQATVDANGKATTRAATTGVMICATAPDVATVSSCATLVITP